MLLALDATFLRSRPSPRDRVTLLRNWQFFPPCHLRPTHIILSASESLCLSSMCNGTHVSGGILFTCRTGARGHLHRTSFKFMRWPPKSFHTKKEIICGCIWMILLMCMWIFFSAGATSQAARSGRSRTGQWAKCPFTTSSSWCKTTRTPPRIPAFRSTGARVSVHDLHAFKSALKIMPLGNESTCTCGAQRFSVQLSRHSFLALLYRAKIPLKP